MHDGSSELSAGELLRFVAESNRIEGIDRLPAQAEFTATQAMLRYDRIGVGDLEWFVNAIQPGAVLRRTETLNVRVGNHIAPRGGPKIVAALSRILEALPATDPWTTHVQYETLHPFTDGNGRSGRMLWAWQMIRRQEGLPLGFLHQFYYQTLANHHGTPDIMQGGDAGTDDGGPIERDFLSEGRGG